MMRGRIAVTIVAVAAGIGMLTGGWGCASRQVASGSGDQSTTTKGKSEIENVKEAQVAAVQLPSAGESPPRQDSRASLFTPSAPMSSSASESKTTPVSVDVTGLGDIFFDFDRYAVRQDAQTVLEGDARWLRNQSGKTFLIEGHCDERGTEAYNLVLGEKRAKATKQYLENLGIPAARLLTTSYGKERPFCKEHNEDCWKYNRRAHFVVQ
jgi:peptidoglycan-associated lipoprotein